MRDGRVLAAYTPGYGGAAEAVLKMTLGNGYGFGFNGGVSLGELFGYSYGSLFWNWQEKTTVTAIISGLAPFWTSLRSYTAPIR